MKKHIRNALYFVLGVLGMNSTSALACTEMYLCIDGIEGESTSKNHPNCIDVLAWSWGMSNSGSTHFPDGGSAGKVAVQDISLTKYLDKATPALMLKVADGTRIADAQFYNYRCGADGPVKYFDLLLENLIVTSVSTGGSGGEDRLTENVTLNFAKVEWCYTPDDGKVGTDICNGWDILTNTPQ